MRSITKASGLGAITAVALMTALSACGSDSLNTGSTGSASPTGSVTTGGADSSLAAMVPADIKAKGTLTIGSDASYAPNEYLEGGTTVVGMDVDLFNAALAKLGLKGTWQNANFDTLILGVTSGKYDAAASSFTINADRMKQVNMISYFSAGSQWVTAKGNPNKVDPDNACGLTVGVQKGTVQVDDLTARSKKCTESGKEAITQVVEQDQSKVTADLISGKVQAMVADSPVALYAVKQTGDKLEAVGKIYDSAPYGIVVAKDQTDFAKAIAAAFTAMEKDGSYKQILAKWGQESGAITTFEVNPSVG
ncbi:polar amino acid transport system substrate-binding protein [Branchiibius hedensis]|uniref:Polar amino acid transport system substrate-binding protein n=1 Tax=Branchiibius hedensis TaxID=672460 RepID=A0A2Y9BT09_9MICO|nr:ABC transporter substrate-binding protein [Branchiibius hedensis]PWJ24425.1 polar amino acid transport system substrate-binding protein [Branchiibius hedensis]SSA33242.1 polar amino acid transport system substrate-binding protein [Branchiibius hedensis]